MALCGVALRRELFLSNSLVMEALSTEGSPDPYLPLPRETTDPCMTKLRIGCLPNLEWFKDTGSTCCQPPVEWHGRLRFSPLIDAPSPGKTIVHPGHFWVAVKNPWDQAQFTIGDPVLELTVHILVGAWNEPLPIPLRSLVP